MNEQIETNVELANNPIQIVADYPVDADGNRIYRDGETTQAEATKQEADATAAV